MRKLKQIFCKHRYQEVFEHNKYYEDGLPPVPRYEVTISQVCVKCGKCRSSYTSYLTEIFTLGGSL